MTQLAQSSLDEVPEWLTPQPAVTGISVSDSPVPAVIPDAATAKRELTLVQYPIVFERAIERIRAGEFMENFIREDIREFEFESFDLWIKQDRERKERLKAAIEARSHVIVAGTFSIADGTDSMEDTQRSKLRIDNAWRKVVADNRKYYGESTKIEMNQTVEVKQSREELLKNAMKFQQTVRDQASGVYSPKPKGDVTDV